MQYAFSIRYVGVDPAPHPHVVCTLCGKIQDVCVPAASELQAQAQVASGYHIAWQRLDFYGVCQDCQQTTGS